MKLFIALLIPLAVGAIAGFATAVHVDSWYMHLSKPWFNPPNNLFGPVWTALYLLMGTAMYLIWKMPVSRERNWALWFYLIQLFLNFCWSFIFFYFHQIAWAMIDIILLWMMVFITIFLFSSVSKTAAWLLVPYISWISFAAILNIEIYKLNV